MTHRADVNADGSRVKRFTITNRPMIGLWELVRRKEYHQPKAGRHR